MIFYYLISDNRYWFVDGARFVLFEELDSICPEDARIIVSINNEMSLVDCLYFYMFDLGQYEGRLTHFIVGEPGMPTSNNRWWDVAAADYVEKPEPSDAIWTSSVIGESELIIRLRHFGFSLGNLANAAEE